MRCRVAIVFVTVILLGAPLATRADVAPPETEGCTDGKKAGDFCTNASLTGVCKDDTCAIGKQDGTASSYPCLKCLPGSNDDTGCSIGGSHPGEGLTVKPVGPWLLGGCSLCSS
jgi:hypothetical protein